MSLAIAYAMKRKKKCHGGDMAKGGDVKGVHPTLHPDVLPKGMSPAGSSVRDARKHPHSGHMAEAKEEHHNVLSEMRHMKGHDRKYMAEGGYCDEGCEMLHEHNYAEGGGVKGVHPASQQAHRKGDNGGTSYAGQAYRDSKTHGGKGRMDHAQREEFSHLAKEEHRAVLDEMHGMKHKDRKYLADGGFVDEEEASGFDPMVEEGEDDLVGRIMKKRCYSEGGKVSNDDMPEADFKEAEYDDLPLDDDLAFHYTGKNSGDECGDEAVEEEDRDVVSRIMKSRKKKDRMPSPA